MDGSLCETCWNYEYNCMMDLDEDEAYRIRSQPCGRCPYYRQGDDYSLARKQ